MSFALFFLGEYANMILMSAMTCILFLGGWLAPFNWAAPFGWLVPVWGVLLVVGKIASGLFLFLWVRATLAALSLRSIDAPGLEGVPAFLAYLCRGSGRIYGRHQSFPGGRLI